MLKVYKDVYRGDWKEIDDVEMKKLTRLVIWLFLYKPKNENVLQLLCKENG